MYCRRCGTKLKENAKFCGVCGNLIGSMPKTNKKVVTKQEVKVEPKVVEIEEKEEKIESKTSTLVVVLLLLITLIVAIGLIVLFNVL